MDVEEMHVGVNLKLQEIASFAYDDLLPQEVDYYLNDAIRKFVDQRKEIIRAEQNSVQSTNAWEDLRSLITEHTFTNDSNGTDLTQASGFSEGLEGSLSDFTDPYLHYLSSRTLLSNGKYVNNRFVKSERLLDFAEQESDTPLYNEFPISVFSSKVIILPSYDMKSDFGPDGTEVWISYITSPKEVDIEGGTNSDLPDHTHDNIVDMSVKLMRQDLGASVGTSNDS